MKIILTFLLTLCFDNLIGQDNNLMIGNKSFKTMAILGGITVYSAQCDAVDDYKFASSFVISYDSTKHIGYLGSYKYTDHFSCQENIDHSVIEQIKALLAERRRPNYKFGILFGMRDNNRDFIGYLSLFTEKKFKKFKKKANRLTKQDFSGETMTIRKYDYHRFAKEFILAKSDAKLSLIHVR